MSTDEKKAYAPGEIISEELVVREWSPECLAGILGWPAQTVKDVIDGKCGITSKMSEELGVAFDIHPDLFFKLQNAYDKAVKGILNHCRLSQLGE